MPIRIRTSMNFLGAARGARRAGFGQSPVVSGGVPRAPHRARRTVLVMGALSLVAFTACSNAGEDRVLSIEASGVVAGFVYFDTDGGREPDGGDKGLAGVEVYLIARGTIDTVGSETTDADGAYSISLVPAGRYRIAVDTSSFADSAEVVRIDTADVDVGPNDSLTVYIAVSFPLVTIAEVRAAPVGEKFFVDAVALTGIGGFGDTTMHIADTSGALRLTNVQRFPQGVFSGDTVRMVGTRQTRLGQPTLDRARVVVVLSFQGVADPVTTASGVAATADGGALDAALVKVLGLVITDTATVDGDYTFDADDGTGVLRLILEQDLAIDKSAFLPDTTLDATGVLVPDGLGSWVLKPRGQSDLVIK